MIKARSGATMDVRSADSTSVVVLLTDKTQVGQTQGVLKVRRKEMSMAALIPGLEVQVEGTYDGQNQLVATSVKFDGGDLERAQAIQAGLHQTQAQAGRNKEELEKQQQQLTAGHEKIAANKAAIDAAMARFGQLDDYYILDEVTVLFGNGKVDIESQYKPQLMQLAEKAKKVQAYSQVVGVSSGGSTAVNPKLGAERAGNVTGFLVRMAGIQLTNVLARVPWASRQMAMKRRRKGKRKNRRVVVRFYGDRGQ